jgi:hypothetical protein
LPPSAETSVPLVNDLPPWDRRLFCRYTRLPTRAPADASALEMDYRLSVPPNLPRRSKDLPGYGAILFVRAVVQHFADLVTEIVARLTTGWGGLTPGGTGFPPAG